MPRQRRHRFVPSYYRGRTGRTPNYSGMTGQRDDGSEEGMDERRKRVGGVVGGGRDKRSKSQACAGMLRIGRHVNLNPFRERRKRRRKGEQGTELEGGAAAVAVGGLEGRGKKKKKRRM